MYLEGSLGWGSFSFTYYSPLKTISFLCSLKRRNNKQELLAAKQENSNIRNVIIRRPIMVHMCCKLPISFDYKKCSWLQLLIIPLPEDTDNHQWSVQFLIWLLFHWTTMGKHFNFRIIIWRLQGMYNPYMCLFIHNIGHIYTTLVEFMKKHWNLVQDF